MDAKAFRAYVASVRLILLLSALLSAIAGYTPVAAARPVAAGQVLCVEAASKIAATLRPANTFSTDIFDAPPAVAPVASTRPLYADRFLI